jgi:hypothetical protein
MFKNNIIFVNNIPLDEIIHIYIAKWEIYLNFMCWYKTKAALNLSSWHFSIYVLNYLVIVRRKRIA